MSTGEKPSTRTSVRTAALAGLLGVATLLAVRADAVGWDEDYFPNTTLLTQEGEPVRFYDDLIRGRIVVIDFIYASCPDICSLSTARMAKVQRALGERVGRDVFMYSISLDPERDTPAVLKGYRDAFDIAPGWSFLTGDVDDVALVRYKLGERSRSLSEHRADVVLGNARTGEWERSSSFQDTELLVRAILDMDPRQRALDVRANPLPPRSLAATDGFADDTGRALFVKACSACHAIGGGELIGPDLAHVTERRDRDWLQRFLADPDALREQGDPLAVELAALYPGVNMPYLGLSAPDIEDLLVHIARRSDALGDVPELVVSADGHGHADEHEHEHDHDHDHDH